MRKHTLIGALAIATAAVAVGLPASSAYSVANGRLAPEGVFPFAVQLTMTGIPKPDGGTRDSACSGALVAPQWVITAGHCFHDVNGDPAGGAPQYKTTAAVGKADLTDQGGAVLDVVDVRQSPANDVALAKLSDPVTGVAPLTVSRREPRAGQELTLAGWGATSSTNPAPATHLAFGEVAVSQVADTTVDVHGVAPQADTSACIYDSGAPYFVPLGRRHGTLVSVESNGPDCPHANAETTSRVDVIADWIDEQVSAAGGY